MPEFQRSNCPDWSEIFRLRPDLEAPGYQEASQSVRDKKTWPRLRESGRKCRKFRRKKLAQKIRIGIRTREKPSATKSRERVPPRQ